MYLRVQLCLGDGLQDTQTCNEIQKMVERDVDTDLKKFNPSNSP